MKQQRTNNQQEELDDQIQIVSKMIQIWKAKKAEKGDKKNERFLIGICGIPGSGKSTVAAKLAKHLENCVVLPMDGFHIPRKQLSEQSIIRRGAAFTFDLTKFSQKIKLIRKSEKGTTIKYPSFDHKQKDPVQDAIQILFSTEIIIVQGLYVFDKNLKINQSQEQKVWDFKIWVNSQLETSIQRVAKRHLESGIEPNYELAFKRANSNDRQNAQYVRQTCFNAEEFKQISNKELPNAIIIHN